MNTQIETNEDINEINQLIEDLRKIEDLQSLPDVTFTVSAVSAMKLLRLTQWNTNRVTPEADTPENRALYAKYYEATISKDPKATPDTWEVWRVRNHSVAFRMLHDASYVETEDGKRTKVWTYNPTSELMVDVEANIASSLEEEVAPVRVEISNGLKSIAQSIAMRLLAKN